MRLIFTVGPLCVRELKKLHVLGAGMRFPFWAVILETPRHTCGASGVISRLVSSHPQVVKCQLCLVSDSTAVKVFACLPSFLQLASFPLATKLPEDQFAFLSSSPSGYPSPGPPAPPQPPAPRTPVRAYK